MSHAVQDAPPAAAPNTGAPNPSTDPGLGRALKQLHEAAARVREYALDGGLPPRPVLQIGVVAQSWTPALSFSLLAACHVRAADALVGELDKYGWIEPTTSALIEAILEVAELLGRKDSSRRWCHQDGFWHYATPAGLRAITNDALRQLLPDLEGKPDRVSAEPFEKPSGDASAEALAKVQDAATRLMRHLAAHHALGLEDWWHAIILVARVPEQLTPATLAAAHGLVAEEAAEHGEDLMMELRDALQELLTKDHGVGVVDDSRPPSPGIEAPLERATEVEPAAGDVKAVSREAEHAEALSRLHAAAVEVRELAEQGSPPLAFADVAVVGMNFSQGWPRELLAASHLQASARIIEVLKECGYIDGALYRFVQAAKDLLEAEEGPSLIYQDGGWHRWNPGATPELVDEAELKALLRDRGSA